MLYFTTHASFYWAVQHHGIVIRHFARLAATNPEMNVLLTDLLACFKHQDRGFPYTPMPFYFSDIFVTLMLKRRNFWWSDGRCCRRCRRIRPATNLGTDLRPIVHNRGPNSIKGCPTRGSYIPHQYQYRKKQWPHHRRTECRPTPQRPDWRHPRTFL